MSVHLFDGSIAGNPAEPLLLEAVTVRLIEDFERERFDAELVTKHYLKNANAVGRVLRYVAEYRGQWVALLVSIRRLFTASIILHWPALCQRAAASHRAELPVSGARRSGSVAESGLPGFEAGVRAIACGLAGAL
jgi:hypothetical protein